MTVLNFLVVIFIGVGVLIALGVWNSQRSLKKANEFKKDFQRHYAFKDSAIALNTETRQIKLKNSGEIKVYDFGDIRSWEKHWHNYNRRGTITVSVKDIHHPVWTTRFGDEVEMNRWNELIKQALNENLKL